MTSAGASQIALGFLTVWDPCDQGLVGGYLLLNHLGRPLEFHCTAPIKPNRAQQILYGPTLKPYLYGEQIGQTLLAKASVEPLLVCTDEAAVLAVRDWVTLPVALVLRDTAPIAERDSVRVDPAASAHAGFHWRANLLAVAGGHDADRTVVESRLATIEDFDLAEPFERIRQAIDEAQRTART